MKRNNVLKNDIENLINGLLEFNNSDEAFVSDLSIPCFKEALNAYFDKIGIDLKEDKVNIKESPIDIDADGYPFVDAYIEIKKFKFSFNCRAYHHKGWDFYIENLFQQKNVYSQKDLKKVLLERKDENNQIGIDVITDLIDDYYIEKEYVFVEVEEGVLAIPYYNVCDKSICTTYDALEIDDSFLVQDNVEKTREIISQYREIANFLEDNLNSK